MHDPVAIILAAGRSTRMKSELPKVLHEVSGRPLIEYVLDAAREAGATRLVLVVGHRAELVRQTLCHHPDVSFALQAEQKGTGHAVMMCAEQLHAHRGPVLILAGDTPLLRGESLGSLLREQSEQQAACVIGTAVTDENFGLGRIVRDPAGNFVRIVEQRDATPEEAAIREINTGCFAFGAEALFASLQKIQPDNAQGEYYLTDCPAVLLSEGQKVIASPSMTMTEAKGVNTRAQLAEVERTLQQSIAERLMAAGVTLVRPDQVWIDARAGIGADTVVHPFTAIRGAAQIGSGCVIGPHAVVDGATVADGTVVPPFSHVRAAD